MLCNSVPGHHQINKLRGQSPGSVCSILFQKIPQLGSPEFVSRLFGTRQQVRTSDQLDGSLEWRRGWNISITQTATVAAIQTPRAAQISSPTAPEIKAAIYVRCSTAGTKRHGSVPIPLHNPEVQLEPLKALVHQRGWNLFRVYSDRMSGAKQARPGLQALMDDARRGRFQVVLVWRFDRFARSVRQLVLALEEFRSLGIDFVSHQEDVDTRTPMGKAMFTTIAAMAELERSIIRERVMAGLEHAKDYGTKSGRPIGRPRRIFNRERVMDLRRNGWSLRQIADELGIGFGTVTWTLKNLPCRRG